MLSYLRVRGLALLDDVSLTFEPGLNVLTGETGAGKSIIVGALSLLRGARSRTEMVREGEDGITIDAQFEPDEGGLQPLLARLTEHGLPTDEPDSLIVSRVVPRRGRGRCFVQATLTTRAVLGGLTEDLIDICSQHEHHFLTHAARHLDVLDAYAQLTDQVADYRETYRALRAATDSLRDLSERAAQRERRVDYLRFQIEEIDRVAPEAGEYEALCGRVSLLRSAHQWVAFAREAQEALYENDDAIATRLAGLADRARGGADDSQQLAALQEQLATAQIACEEAASLAATLVGELELDPRELEAAEERLHELESLRRKHGGTADELAQRADEMRVELTDLESADEHIAALEARRGELEAACRRKADALHTARTDAAGGLARGVEAELAALQIKSANLHIDFGKDDEVGPRGIDRVEFLFSANRGEAVAPLRRVASGGELSRVLLAIKGVLAAGDRVATYVFDEVDAGVGGAAAEAIGRRLRKAAAGHQVLCVTHLPQIAAFADAHFRVEKRTVKGRTTTRVLRLSDDDRVEELARMLAGRKVGPSARDHAAALIDSARR